MKKRNYTKLLLSKWTQCAKRSLVVLFIALANIQMYAHTVQAAWGFSPNGDLRIYLEHWHGDFIGPPNNSTIQLTVSVNGGSPTTSTLIANGVVNNTLIGNLPKAANTNITVISTCTDGSANTYNDWAYWDTPVPPALCPDGGTLTVTVDNPNDVNFEDCGGLFPAIASSFVNDCPCVITCPGDQQLNLDANCQVALPDYTSMGVASEDCEMVSMITQSPAPGTVITGETDVMVTLTAVDGGANPTCTFTVSTNDVTAPAAVCTNVTVDIQANEMTSVTASQIASSSSDACSAVSLNISTGTTSYNCDDNGMSFPVTVTVSDDSGNTAQCVAMVEVQKGTDLPVEWSHSSVGNANGNAVYDPCEELFCIESNGVSNPLLDKCYVAYQHLCGSNMEIIARVVSVGPNHGFGGIMIRESMGSGSKKIAMKTQLGNSHFIQRDTRVSTNGLANTRQIFRPGTSWLRIVRTGNQFLCYTSYDGSYWRFADYLVINMSECVDIGLFSEGVHGNVLTTACFDNVSISGGIIPQLIENGNNWETETVRATDFEVFPNPAVNQVNIDLSQFENDTFTMSIYNNIGQLILRKEYLYLEDSLEKLDVSQYSNGIYLINIELEDGTVLNKKLVVNK